MYKRTKSVLKIEKAISETCLFCEAIYDIHWVPLGKDFEMMGREGGWTINGKCVATNLRGAIDFIMNYGIDWV